MVAKQFIYLFSSYFNQLQCDIEVRTITTKSQKINIQNNVTNQFDSDVLVIVQILACYETIS